MRMHRLCLARKRMPNSRGMTIRIPEDVLLGLRKVKAEMEQEENRSVSLNEVILMGAMKLMAYRQK